MICQIEFPIVVKVSDYHDFEPLARLFSQMVGNNVRYKERESDVPYEAVFFVGKRVPDVDEQNLRTITFG